MEQISHRTLSTDWPDDDNDDDGNDDENDNDNIMMKCCLYMRSPCGK